MSFLTTILIMLTIVLVLILSGWSYILTLFNLVGDDDMKEIVLAKGSVYCCHNCGKEMIQSKNDLYSGDKILTEENMILVNGTLLKTEERLSCPACHTPQKLMYICNQDSWISEHEARAQV